MVFIILLIFSTLAVAGSAAFFSVYGLAQIFSASFIPVVIMGGALEAGKLVAASYLYRYWKETSFILRTYLFIAIFTLMVITSLGIFGFLTAAYQTDSIGLKQQREQIALYEAQKISYTERLAGINADIARTGDNYISKRIELMGNFKQEKDQLIADITEADAKLLELKSTVLQTEAKIGPIIYVAEQLQESPDKATFWFTLLIIAVFDPLAVALTLGSNIAIRQRWPQQKVVHTVDAVTQDNNSTGNPPANPLITDIIESPSVNVEPEISESEITVDEPTPQPTVDTSEITDAITDVKKLAASKASKGEVKELAQAVDKLKRNQPIEPKLSRSTGSHTGRIL